jgi:hypothetical protein
MTKKFRKKNRKTHKKGGKIVGYGTYGIVMGEPGYPCSDTDKIPMLYNIVSKIAKNDKDANLISELNGGKLLTKIKGASKFFILPLKNCKFDDKYTNMYPTIYNARWRIHENSILSITEMQNKEMLLFEKAENNMVDSFEDSIVMGVFHDNNIRLLNVAKGIHLLQVHGLIHNDIKPDNCVLQNNTFKMIDLADIRNIVDTNNMRGMYINFGYFTWSPIVSYSYLFHANTTEMKSYAKINTSNHVTLLKDNFNMNENSTEFNSEQYGKTGNIKKALYDSFRHFIYFLENYKEKDFSEIKKNVETYSILLIYQKTFGIIEDGKYNTANIKKLIHYFTNKIEDSKVVQDLDDKVNKCLETFYNFIAPNRKIDLLKRVDIYSFGIMLLIHIYNFFNFYNKDKTPEELYDYDIEYFYRLFQIAFYCCYQNFNAPNIRLIVRYYEFVLTLYNNIIAEEDADDYVIELSKKYMRELEDISHIGDNNHFEKKISNYMKLFDQHLNEKMKSLDINEMQKEVKKEVQKEIEGKTLPIPPPLKKPKKTPPGPLILPTTP